MKKIISKKLGKISWKNSSKFRTFFEKKIERKEMGRKGIVRKGERSCLKGGKELFESGIQELNGWINSN